MEVPKEGLKMIGMEHVPIKGGLKMGVVWNGCMEYVPMERKMGVEYVPKKGLKMVVEHVPKEGLKMGKEGLKMTHS